MEVSFIIFVGSYENGHEKGVDEWSKTYEVENYFKFSYIILNQKLEKANIFKCKTWY